jgi:hypothetical protein
MNRHYEGMDRTIREICERYESDLAFKQWATFVLNLPITYKCPLEEA